MWKEARIASSGQAMKYFYIVFGTTSTPRNIYLCVFTEKQSVPELKYKIKGRTTRLNIH